MAKKKAQTALEQVHERLGTKNTKEVLEATEKMQNAIQTLVKTDPIVVVLSINPVTGRLSLTNSPLREPQRELKLVLNALKQAEDNVTQTLFNMLGEDAPEDTEEGAEDDTEE
jgi:hypothetical protein